MKTKTHASTAVVLLGVPRKMFLFFFLHPSPITPPAFPTAIWPEILLTPLGTAAESLLQCITTSTTSTRLFTEAPPSSQSPLSSSVTSPSGVPLQTRHDSRPHAYRRTGETRVQPPPATPQNTPLQRCCCHCGHCQVSPLQTGCSLSC